MCVCVFTPNLNDTHHFSDAYKQFNFNEGYYCPMSFDDRVPISRVHNIKKRESLELSIDAV